MPNKTIEPLELIFIDSGERFVPALLEVVGIGGYRGWVRWHKPESLKLDGTPKANRGYSRSVRGEVPERPDYHSVGIFDPIREGTAAPLRQEVERLRQELRAKEEELAALFAGDYARLVAEAEAPQ